MDERDRHKLSEAAWRSIQAHLEPLHSGRGRPAFDDRAFFDAVLWMLRTGAPWRDLPREFGPWQRTYRRFFRWKRKGIWAGIYRLMRDLKDVKNAIHSLDSTSVRVHQHGAPKRTERELQAVGVSRGGKTTKLHLLAYASRDGGLLPPRGVLSAGQVSDITAAPSVLQRVPKTLHQLTAGRAYDAN